MRFLLITDEGIEDITGQELLEAQPSAEVHREPFGFKGHVVVDGVPLDELLRLTTIQHVIELRGEAEARSLADLRRAMAGIDVPEMIDASSFRVTSERRGEHDFDHMEIQRVAGAVLVERYGTPVDLEHHELNVRVDLYGDRLVAGVQRTAKSLGNRIKRVRALRTALKPSDMNEDKVHLTSSGRRITAEQVADFLLREGLLRPSRLRARPRGPRILPGA